MSLAELDRTSVARRLPSFLLVGGAGYVVDVAVFNLARTTGPLASADPAWARVAAVAVAMAVTYLGNRLWTWRDRAGLRAASERRREVGLFVLFNLAGLVLSIVPLVISHDLLGMTSRLADNISANVIGIGLGTLFRYVCYERFVFTSTGSPVVEPARERERVMS